MKKKTYDSQTGSFIAKIATHFPNFSGEVLQHWINLPTKQLRKQIGEMFCPVWHPAFEIGIKHALEVGTFCNECKVGKEVCPGAHVDLARIAFKTFEHSGHVDVGAYGCPDTLSRIVRLAESSYEPMSMEMFLSIERWQRKRIKTLTTEIREDEGVIVFDRYLYDPNMKDNAYTFTKAFRNRIRKNGRYFLCDSNLAVDALWWDQNSWKFRSSSIHWIPNRPTYSAVFIKT